MHFKRRPDHSVACRSRTSTKRTRARFRGSMRSAAPSSSARADRTSTNQVAARPNGPAGRSPGRRSTREEIVSVKSCPFGPPLSRARLAKLARRIIRHLRRGRAICPPRRMAGKHGRNKANEIRMKRLSRETGRSAQVPGQRPERVTGARRSGTARLCSGTLEAVGGSSLCPAPSTSRQSRRLIITASPSGTPGPSCETRQTPDVAVSRPFRHAKGGCAGWT